MRPNRAAAKAAACAFLPAVLLSTGCGGSDDPAAAPAAERLRQALVTTADIAATGLTVAESSTGADAVPAADNAACQPVLDLLSARAAGTPASGLVAATATNPPKTAELTAIVLVSYPNGDAQKIMDRGIAALASCPTFTGPIAGGGKAEYAATNVQASSYGDQSATVKLVTTSQGESITAQYIVARVGGTLVDVVLADTKGGPGGLPASTLVAKQIDKVKTVG